MTILTKTARQEVLTKVLKEAFEPKFADLRKRLLQYARDWLRTNHPVFEELLARKDARGYLQTKHFYRLYINSTRLYYPDYDQDARLSIRINELTVPYVCVDDFVIVDDNIELTYNTLWDSYNSAHSELSKILEAYRTREALLVDFPEYATYLPAITIKQLPAVVPSESRAKLSALGIPSK